MRRPHPNARPTSPSRASSARPRRGAHPALRAGSMRCSTSSGQAAVELVAVIPVVVLLAAGLWQAVVAGQALWLAGAAARAAARADAVGGDAKDAARTKLPPGLENGLRVKAGDGKAEVDVRVPLVLVGGRLGTVSASAHFEPQDA